MPSILRGIAAKVYALLEKHYSPKFSAVVCVTPQLQERFVRYGANTHLITNYPVVEGGLAEEPAYAGNRDLCFAGGVVPKWLHENVISVLADCDAQYVLAGSPSDPYITKLKALDGWQYVDYKSVLPHEDIPALMRGCAVGMALHDYTESMQGNIGTIGVTKLFEYMLNGLPVVCSDFLEWKTIIETENCGICVNPRDTSAIASAIRFLLDHPDDAAQMGRNGRRAVLEKYNWRTQEQELFRLYRMLCE